MLSAFVGGAVLCSARADEFARAGLYNVSVSGQYLASDAANVVIDGVQASAQLEGVVGGGLGVGYDITDHFALNIDVWGGGGDLKVEAAGRSLSEGVTAFGGNVALDWNILKSRFTPFLSANLGFLSLSGDGGGLPASETDLTYGVGGGLRWDISEHWSAKATYRINWTQFQGFDETSLVHMASVGLGFRF